MANSSGKKYFIKLKSNGSFPSSYSDITSAFPGVAILKIDGFLDKGKPVNVFTQQFVNSQTEDFMITSDDGSGNPVVIRENTDITITFIVSRKYDSSVSAINVRYTHDAFVSALTNNDVWLMSKYMDDMQAHCVCLKDYKPTVVKLDRGNKSYIMGTITLHCIEAITKYSSGT